MNKKKTSTAYLLCALGFLGVGGIHRFYLNRPFTAILYFFTYGFFFIGTIADLFGIKAMVDKENLKRHNNGDTYNNNSPQVVINLGEKSQYDQHPPAVNTSKLKINSPQTQKKLSSEQIERKILKLCQQNNTITLIDCLLELEDIPKEILKARLESLVHQDLLIIGNRESDGVIIYELNG